MKKILVAAVCTAVMFGCDSTKSTTSTTPKPTKVANASDYASSITQADLKRDLTIYASDEFEGRDTGKPGQKKAIDYIKKHYQRLGISSPLKSGSYFQNVPLQIGKKPYMSMVINGKTLEGVTDFVAFSAGEDTTLKADEIVDLSYGIDDEKFSNYTNVDVKGKIVLIKAGEPKNADGTYKVTGTTEASKWSNMRQQFGAKFEAAKKNGAKVILFNYPDIYAMVAPRFAEGGGRMSLKDNSKNDTYFFLVNSTVVDAIGNANTTDDTKITKANVTLNFKSNAENLNSENVLAFIKGTEKPDEVVVISAHLDHVGMNEEGEIFNGADDDGSGTVAVMEIAEAFQKAVKDGNGPKRSILFLHVTGEEKGLLGSRYYTDVEPIIPLANTVVDLNIDMVGRTDPKREGSRNYVYLIGSDKLSTELHELSENVNKNCCNVEFDYTYNDENDPNRFYYRSDHYNFAKNDIPVIFYFNGTHDDYHQPSDTVDKIEFDLLENRTRLIFHTAWEIANRDKRLFVDKPTKK